MAAGPLLLHRSYDSTGTYPPIGHNGLPYSIVDLVKVPSDLEPGEYLLSWRWDCEQSHQIVRAAAAAHLSYLAPRRLTHSLTAACAK